MLREYGGLTRKEFGKLFHSKDSTVYEWEIGYCIARLPKLVNISSYFGVSLDFIVNGIMKEENPLEVLLGRADEEGVFEFVPSAYKTGKFIAQFNSLSARQKERLIGYLDALCREGS